MVADGEGEIGVAMDGEPAEPIHGRRPPASPSSAGTGRHEAHRVELDVPEGIRIWAISFAPGLP